MKSPDEEAAEQQLLRSLRQEQLQALADHYDAADSLNRKARLLVGLTAVAIIQGTLCLAALIYTILILRSLI